MIVRESISFQRYKDPKKALGFDIDLTGISEIKVNNFIPNNNHTNAIQNLIKNGYDIRVNFYSEVVKKIYDNNKDKLILFLQNDGITSLINDETYWVQYSPHIPKDDVYTANGFMPTIGRYNIDTSMTYSMTPSEITFAKTLYKGENNREYPFFFNDTFTQIAFIVSKSGKFITLVIEGIKEKNINEIEKYGFTQIPHFSDCYLGRWLKIDEIIEIVKNIKL